MYLYRVLVCCIIMYNKKRKHKNRKTRIKVSIILKTDKTLLNVKASSMLCL